MPLSPELEENWPALSEQFITSPGMREGRGHQNKVFIEKCIFLADFPDLQYRMYFMRDQKLEREKNSHLGPCLEVTTCIHSGGNKGYD